MALESPAYKLFNDDFLESFPNADKAIIYAEPEKKENRTKKGFDMSFKEFVKRYKNESLYMVNALPMELRSVLFSRAFLLTRAIDPFLYPPENFSKPLVFCCFQGYRTRPAEKMG